MFQQSTGGVSYNQFLPPGIIAMAVLFTATFSGIEVIWDKQFGFLKETLVAPVSRMQIMFGRTLGGATVATLQGLAVFLACLILGFRPANLWLLPVALLFMFMIGLFFTALGTAIASKLDDMQGFQLIMNFLIMPIFFMSGALFPVDGLPPAFVIITRLDPLSYGVDGLRMTLSGLGSFGTGIDLLVLGVLTFIFLAWGSWMFSKIQS